MKNILAIITAVCMLACQKKTEHKKQLVQVSVIVDITDRQTTGPDAGNIIRLFELWNNKDKEITFRLLTTTDKVLNPEITLHLPDGETTEKENKRDIPLFREKIIRQFNQNIRNTIDRFNNKRNEDTALSHSECFATVANELTQLKSQRADKSILLVYSDLQENSRIFSCYTAKGKSILEQNPEKVFKIFSTSKLLPADLAGITVVFIYNPKTREDDIHFMAMQKVYKKLLEAKAAKVTVSASNNLNIEP